MGRARGGVVVALALLTSACGTAKSNHAAPPAPPAPVWTSPAEPSPPGSSSRWGPADARQLAQAG